MYGGESTWNNSPVEIKTSISQRPSIFGTYGEYGCYPCGGCVANPLCPDMNFHK